MTNFTISILTNGWFTQTGYKAFKFKPCVRGSVGLSTHFESVSFTEKIIDPTNCLSLEEEEMVLNLEHAYNAIAAQIHNSKKPAGFANVPDALAEMNRLQKSKQAIYDLYAEEATEQQMALFDSTEKKIGFKISVDTAADIIGHAQKGRIVEITHAENGEIENITVREPRLYNRAKPTKAAATLK